MTTGLKTKQYTVSRVDTDELFRAMTIRSATRLAAAAREQVVASTEASPIAVEIDGKEMRGYLEDLSYPKDATAACKLTAVDISAGDRIEYDVSLTLTKHGWGGTATILHIGIDD